MAAFENDLEKVWYEKGNHAKIDKRLSAFVEEAVDSFSPDGELEKIKKIDVGYITIFDKKFPKQLIELHDAPAILYIKGDVASLNSFGLGVVGSRAYTQYGKQAAERLSKECARSGMTIYSGLALGIDTIAHQAALDVKGITVGVLGCGLDQIYPQSNVNLAKNIINSGGAIVSEFAVGTVPQKFNFPARNRIIAGLSAGVLVVEAAEKSGALITAYAALEYNREVFAVPGSIFSETSAGCHRLIQQGAKLVHNSEDVLSEFNIETKKMAMEASDFLPETKEEKIILTLLSKEDKLADTIVLETGFNIVAVNTTLTILEMKGMVRNVGGGYFSKIV